MIIILAEREDETRTINAAAAAAGRDGLFPGCEHIVVRVIGGKVPLPIFGTTTVPPPGPA